MSVTEQTPAPQPKRRLRGFLYAGTLLIGGGVVGAIVVGPVLGQGPGPQDGPRWHRGDSDGSRWNRGGDDNDRGGGWRERFGRDRGMRQDNDGHGMRGGFSGMMFPGAIERRVNRVLGAVDASTEQKQKVRSILEAAANDLYPIRQKRMENRKQIGEALTAATIDRAKIESLRTDQIKLADAASKRMTDAIAESAEVLTPGQRAELGRRLERWRQGRRD